MPNAEKVKRSLFAQFLDIVPGEQSPSYKRMGKGITNGAIAYNPSTSNETYIDEDSASISVDSYAPTLPTNQTAFKGDDVFDYIDGLRQQRAVGADAETDILLVYMYDFTESSGVRAYATEKQKVSIQFDDFGGDGGDSNKINYTLNFVGNSVRGTTTITAGVPTFTATV